MPVDACDWRVELQNHVTKEIKYYQLNTAPIDLTIDTKDEVPGSRLKVQDIEFYRFVHTDVKCSVLPPKEYQSDLLVVVTECAYSGGPKFQVHAFGLRNKRKEAKVQISSILLFGKVGDDSGLQEESYTVVVDCL